MECANCGRFLRGDLTQGFFESEKWKAALCPEGGNGGGDFLVEDLGKLSIFYLPVESSLYKYMRICLWSDAWRRLCIHEQGKWSIEY
jgi:hypothetical protein